MVSSYLRVNGMIDNLNMITDMIVSQNEQNFFESYKEHMLKVQCELVTVKKSVTEGYNKWKKDERLKFLESSIHWLRGEALTLCKSLEDIKVQNGKLRQEAVELRKENNYLTEYTRATKRENLGLKRVIEQLKDPKNMIRYVDAMGGQSIQGLTIVD